MRNNRGDAALFIFLFVFVLFPVFLIAFFGSKEEDKKFQLQKLCIEKNDTSDVCKNLMKGLLDGTNQTQK